MLDVTNPLDKNADSVTRFQSKKSVFCLAVEWFFHHASFPVGCNSSFIALIPKTLNPKSVGEYRPISLIGSIYKIVTKILANRLSTVIADIISNVQTAFLPNRQILDGPFIINELLARCHHKKHSAMVFKIDFAKAYDSIRWDYLGDVLKSFGFGVKWCSWIRGILNSSMASILVNGSPTKEFQFHRGLKQGDPLAPYLFIIIMESLHLSFSRVIEAGIFTGIKIDSSTTLSHLFYADDAVFIGEWSRGNLTGIMHTLRCFSLLSGLSINLKKSQLLGVGIPESQAKSMSSRIEAWDETVNKLKMSLLLGSSKTLSIEVLRLFSNSMESIRAEFFQWYSVMARKRLLGLAGLRSIHALYAPTQVLLFLPPILRCGSSIDKNVTPKITRQVIKWIYHVLDLPESRQLEVNSTKVGSSTEILESRHGGTFTS
ncbi:RNA-directed DNA polymerase, eukaryota [Tanacetum coccineum]